jgi:hypothetical protein
VRRPAFAQQVIAARPQSLLMSFRHRSSASRWSQSSDFFGQTTQQSLILSVLLRIHLWIPKKHSARESHPNIGLSVRHDCDVYGTREVYRIFGVADGTRTR